TQVMNQGHAELAVQKLFRHLEVPFEGTQGTVRLTANAGAAICPVHASHPEFLMRQAEKSLALARATGQNWLFPPEVDVDQGFSEFWDLEIELDGAIERGELLLSYQPKLRASDLATIGAEALMSWPHRTRGLVSPAQFIPIAEKNRADPADDDVGAEHRDAPRRYVEAPVAAVGRGQRACRTGLARGPAGHRRERDAALGQVRGAARAGNHRALAGGRPAARLPDPVADPRPRGEDLHR